MKIADKVALILSRYGFSLAEGLEIYKQFAASEDEELVHVDKAKDCAVFLNTLSENAENPEESKNLTITVWLNYASDFCLNYNLAGAVAMHDRDFDFDEEDTNKFLEFFQLCNNAYRANQDSPELPELPDDMAWVFKLPFLEDYMENSSYDVNETTSIKIDWSEF